MNILHLNPRLNITCGISKTIYNICINVNNSFNYFLICFGGDAVDYFKSKGLNVTVIPRPASFVSYISLLVKLYKFIKTNRIDIVHSHHRIFDSIIFFLRQFTKMKTLTSVHSKVYGKKIFSYKADVLIAVSKTIFNHLINYFHKKRERIYLINNFASIDKFENIKFDKPEVLNAVSPNSKIILFIGRLDEEKGIDILLEAIKVLQNDAEGDKYFLIIVGDGKMRKYCKNFIDENNLYAATVEATTRVIDFYNITDVVVLPSRVDPFPLVVLEAGLMQKPFIGSKVDGIEEIIDDGTDGILCESGNVKSLVAAICNVLEDQELATTLAKNLHRKIINNYTADTILPKYQELYKELKRE